jgi:hypothetical protein
MAAAASIAVAESVGARFASGSLAIAGTATNGSSIAVKIISARGL